MLPLVIGLAKRERLVDVEGAAFTAFQALRTYGAAWPCSGLPPKVWVVGIALQAFQGLPRTEVES